MTTTMDQSGDKLAEQFLQSTARNVDLNFQRIITFPGDIVTNNVTGLSKSISIGPGLKQEESDVVATSVGVLNYRAKSHYWIESNRKRYYPKVNDQVVGIIKERGVDFYTINLFSGTSCILDRLKFEGATKRSKPELKKGDVVYARVEATGKDLDTELSCISTSGVTKEWSTGETIYGELPQGLLVHLSLATVHKLLLPECAVLNALGSHICFEAAIGMNGAVWFRANGPKAMAHNVVIRNSLTNMEQMPDDLHAVAMVEHLVQMSNKIRTS